MPEAAIQTLADVEAEHALQYKLLGEVERALTAGDERTARELAAQLHEYSEVHFGSEQVLMRLHAYPRYQLHLREHGELLIALRNLTAAIGKGGTAGEATALRRWLTTHIQNADQDFVEFVRDRA